MQEKLNLKEGDKLIVKKVNGKLVVKKKLTAIDLLEQPILAKVTLEEIDKELETLREEMDKKMESKI